MAAKFESLNLKNLLIELLEQRMNLLKTYAFCWMCFDNENANYNSDSVCRCYQAYLSKIKFIIVIDIDIMS